MIRTLQCLLIGFSLLSALYLFVLLLNAGVEIDDARSAEAHLKKQNSQLLSIVRREWIGKKAASVADMAGEFEQEGVIVKKTKDGSFEIGELIFEIKDGAVMQVRYFD